MYVSLCVCVSRTDTYFTPHARIRTSQAFQHSNPPKCQKMSITACHAQTLSRSREYVMLRALHVLCGARKVSCFVLAVRWCRVVCVYECTSMPPPPARTFTYFAATRLPRCAHIYVIVSVYEYMCVCLRLCENAMFVQRP